MAQIPDLLTEERAYGCRFAVSRASVIAERTLRSAVLSAADAFSLPVTRQAAPNPGRGVHARGRFADVTVDGRFWLATCGYVTPYGNVRMYWRSEGHRTLEVQVRCVELPTMAAWCVAFLAGAPGWERPPYPVTSELATFGRECRYLWTAQAEAVYYRYNHRFAPR